MKHVARNFLGCLDREQDQFEQKLAQDTTGITLIAAVREFDFYYYNYVRREQSDDADFQFYILRLGLPRLVAGALGRTKRFDFPVVLFRTAPRLVIATLELVSAFGFVEHGRRMALAAMAGECNLYQQSDDQFEFVLADDMLNMEHHESSVAGHYTLQHRARVDSGIKESFERKGTFEHIQNLLDENVYVFRDHFIGYNAHPDLDDYFFGLAYLRAQSLDGFDAFHWSAEFGGVTFQKYVLASIYFLSLAMKHERFCEALLAANSDHQLRDVLTITAEKSEFLASTIEAVNLYGTDIEGFQPLTSEEAAIVIDALSVRRDNLQVIAPTMSPLPYLIEYSDSAWIKSIAGAHLDPFNFMLTSLKQSYPKDYDRNQQHREGSMQKALRRLIKAAIPNASFLDNITLRNCGKTVTDIDFVAIDEETGFTMLFQLKHQDHYGGDFRKRSSQAKRLQEQSSSWLEKVRSWIRSSSHEEICSTLRRKSNSASLDFRLIIVTKNFAHFLATVDLNEDAAYATWVQFYDSLVRVENAPEKVGSLRYLFDELSAHMTHKIASKVWLETVDNFHLDTLSFRIRQERQEI
ncbi:MAG: hypothetical protein IE925_06060 [Rhodobacterales bacterium]|nr:hypothetical protein [Rhodobacterales bacterium]